MQSLGRIHHLCDGDDPVDELCSLLFGIAKFAREDAAKFREDLRGEEEYGCPQSGKTEAGDLFTVTAAAGKIVLMPARLERKRTTAAEWKALRDLVDTEEARGAFTEYPMTSTAKHHLRRTMKR